jgi:RNA polymerase sigma factor (sigma-70 family)
MQLSRNARELFAEQTDQDIWEHLRQGNDQALEYFYRTYAKELFNFGMKLYSKSEFVQDGLHELFVDLWNQHQQLSSISSVKTYLFKSLKYKLHRQYSKEKYWINKVEYQEAHHAEVEFSLESHLIADQTTRENKLKILKSLEKLPARQKEVLHLLFDDGFSYEETAEIMGINVRSVYTLAWKGISSLKKCVKDFLLIASFFLFIGY